MVLELYFAPVEQKLWTWFENTKWCWMANVYKMQNTEQFLSTNQPR